MSVSFRCFCFFKQKTAYEMRISDWSSDVCSSDLELASHGYDHQRVFAMTADRFAADLKKTRAILEDLGGVAIRGYRAPSFSIDTRTPWAHPVLAEQIGRATCRERVWRYG